MKLLVVTSAQLIFLGVFGDLDLRDYNALKISFSIKNPPESFTESDDEFLVSVSNRGILPVKKLLIFVRSWAGLHYNVELFRIHIKHVVAPEDASQGGTVFKVFRH